MAVSPNTDNYSLGKGVVSFDQKDITSGLYGGERDLGNAPAFSFNIALEKLEHFSSRGGLKAKDKEIISQITPGVSFTLDEINKDNFALLTLADMTEVAAAAGVVTSETATVHLEKRSELVNRGIGKAYALAYDDSAADNVIFVVGEVVSGAVGVGTVLAVTGDATSGTLTIALTTAGFVQDETVTGSGSGTAEVDSATGEVAIDNAAIVYVTDAATGLVTYVAGTDYEIDLALKDDVIGRIKWLLGGTVIEDEEVEVTYGYDAAAYTTIQAFKNTLIEGKLRFVSDNPAGTNQELEIWRCSLTPTGDTAMIGDDWSTLGFTGEILKDETGHPDSPYMDIIMV